MKSLEKRQLASYSTEKLLLMLVAAMMIFGLIMVYSASFIYAQERTGNGLTLIYKQFAIAVVGTGAMLGVARIPSEKFSRYGYLALIISALLLVAVMIPGVGARVGGAQRWLRLGLINLQPGEVAKFAVLIFIASLLTRKRDRLNKFVPGMVSPFLLISPVLLLLMVQPDFGTTVMICIAVFCMLFLAGIPKRFLASALLIAGSLGTYLALSTPYRRARVMTFIDPWTDPMGKGFQVIQSMVGMYHGNLTGVGLGNGKEKLFYLPEAHNDFIFAVIGEELGFIGVIAVCFSYLAFIYLGLKIALDAIELRNDFFGGLLATGITLALGIQGFVNMAVVLALVPTKGLTLPLISYGGSALLVDLTAIGILLGIARTTSAPSPSVTRVQEPA